MKRTKKLWIGLICITLAVLLPLGACTLYVCDYYRADTAAIAAMAQGDGAATLTPQQQVTFSADSIAAFMKGE